MPAKTAADRGREARARLLRAAVELIPEIGWNAVSTRILAERAGVLPGLVHYHFRSLRALLRAAAVGAMRDELSAAQSMLEQARTTEAGLRMMLGALDMYTGTDPTSLLFTETYLVATRDEELRAQLAALLVEFREGLTGWLRVHRQRAPEATASVLAAAIDGMLLHRALNPRLTSAFVAPVLRRLLVSGGTDDR
ncbi:MAG: TetR/AcrR family transcriptional regulator [Sciscionella sp.]